MSEPVVEEHIGLAHLAVAYSETEQSKKNVVGDVLFLAKATS